MSQPPPLPPQASVPHFTAPASEKKSGCKRAAIIGGILAALGLLFVAAIAAYSFSFLKAAKSVPVGDAWKECALTAKDLAEIYEIDIDPNAETWNQLRHIDRSKEVDYDYDPPNESLYINSNLCVERKRSDAVASYLITSKAAAFGLDIAGEGVTRQVDPSIIRWGEQSEFAWILIDEDRLGFSFVGRKKLRIFQVIVSGLEDLDKETVETLLLPRLEAFEKAKL